MPDPVIKVGIQATTNAAEVQIAQAYQKMAAASLELQNVQSRHTDILKNYSKSALDASTTTTLLSENLREQTAATEQLTAAKMELKAASQGEVRVQQEVSGAVQKTVSSYYAAQGAARVLEGGIPIRAFEKFISTISGVGPLLQAAFPVIGIVAMAELLIDAGEKLGKFAADAGALGRELGTGWLDGAIAQMSSLGKEIKQADAELLRLAGDRDQIRERQQSADVEHARLQTQVGTYQKLTQGLGPENAGNQKQYAKAAREAAAAGEKAADQEHADQLNKRIAALEKIKVLNLESAQVLGQQADAQDAIDRIGSIGVAKLRKEQEVSNSQFRDALAEQKLLIQEKNDLLLKGQIAGQRADRAAGTGGTKENYADELAAAKDQGAGYAVIYWEAVVEKTGKYHEQLLRAEERFQKELREKGKFAAALNRDENKEEAKPPAASADLQNITDYYNQTGQAYARYREEVAKGNQILAENAEKLQAVRIEIALQSGALSRVAADHALGAARAKEFADRIAELRGQLAALKADLPNQEAEGKGGDAAAQIQALQNQITALTGQAAATAAQNQGNTAKDLAAPYLHAFDTINTAWLGMQNKLIFGTKNISREFANMGVSILESVAGSFEKMLAQQLKFELQSIIAHQTANTTKVASDATAATAGDAIKTTSALKENFMNAKTAATGAFKGVMSAVPPPLNFILAPVAAAAAFAGTLAVGAFEKGGLIGGPTLALMGESGTEAVLPARLTTLLLNAAGSSSSSSSSESTTFNQANHYSGITDRDFRQKLRKHSGEVANSVSRELRGGRKR